MNKADRLKLQNIFNEISQKRGGKISEGNVIAGPEYRFMHSDTEVAVVRGPLGKGANISDITEKYFHTYVQITLKQPSSYYIAITRKQLSAFAENTFELLIKIMPFLRPGRKVEIAGFSSQGINVVASDKTFIENLLTDALKNNIIAAKQKFNFFRLYIEGRNMHCSFQGTPDSSEDLSLLINTTLYLYDRYKELGLS